MSRYILALDRTAEDRFIAELLDRGHSVLARAQGARELQGIVSELRPDVVLVGANRATLTAELLAICDRLGVRVIALAETDPERQYAVGLGLYEVVDARCAWVDIEALSASPLAAELGEAPRPHPESGDVIAVWGPAGAPGRTTVAIGVAAELAAAGKSVVLVDADTYAGAIAPTLGMLDESPGFAAACRLAAADGLNRAELERIAQRHDSPSGAFWVLTGIARAARWPELGEARVRATIDACRDWAEYTVIDTGFSLENDEEISSDLFAPRRNAATMAALRAADRVLAVGLADPVGMARFLRARTDLLDLVDEVRVSVLMNRVRASAVGLGAVGQVEATLRRFGGIQHATLIPHDMQAADAAVLSAQTLRDTAPKSPARLAIARFVRTEILLTTLPEPRRRSLGRARGRRAVVAPAD